MKQFVDRWSGATVKEADALIQAKEPSDLLHTVATMSALCLKDAELVEKIGLRPLKDTIDVELYYKSTQHVIVGYSDASFAPQGSRSFVCSVLLPQPAYIVAVRKTILDRP